MILEHHNRLYSRQSTQARAGIALLYKSALSAENNLPNKWCIKDRAAHQLTEEKGNNHQTILESVTKGTLMRDCKLGCIR